MPTYERLPRFHTDYAQLTAEQRAAFRDAVGQLIADLRNGTGRFHPSLRVHRIDAQRGVWSMSFGSDLRATFAYGQAKHAGEPHIIWRRIGHHRIYRQP